MSTHAPEIVRMMFPATGGPDLFERVAAPAVARMNRDLTSDELGSVYTESAGAQKVAFERLAASFELRGLHGLAAFYQARANELR